MTSDEAVALSFAFLSDLRRSGLTDRLFADDPNLVELARSLMARANAARADAASRGIHVVGWNEPAFPSALLTLSDVPPALWYRGRLDVLNATAVAVVGSRTASAIAIETATRIDRKSTRLNSSHRCISYAVFCLKKKITLRPTKLLTS